MPKRHKNLFFRLSKEKFYKDLSKLKSSVNTLSDGEITMELSKIVACVGDGYTRLQFDMENILPLKLYWFE